MNNPPVRETVYHSISRDRYRYLQNPAVRQHAVREFAFGFKLIPPPKTS